jgi:glyoxylase-like metal-dependent hydrolase (beta-lactamase superfamily II)
VGAILSKTEAGLDLLRIGDVSVYRIADIDGIAWAPQAMFDLPAAQLDDLMRAAPDASIDRAAHQIRLSFNSYLIRTSTYVALIDCGAGNDKSRLDRPAWHRRQGDFLDQLRSTGTTPDDIDLVVNTHLHADHVGWNTTWRDGAWHPTFPRARYVVGDRELAFWCAHHDAAHGEPILHGAFADSVQPLLDHGVLDAVPLPTTLATDLTLEPAYGHSPGMAIVRLKTDVCDLVVMADVIHHPLQLARPEIGTKFCEDLPRAQKTRLELLESCATKGTIVAPYHFPSPGFARVTRAGSNYAFVDLDR